MFPAFLCDKHCSDEQICAYFSDSSFQHNFLKVELRGQVIMNSLKTFDYVLPNGLQTGYIACGAHQ